MKYLHVTSKVMLTEHKKKKSLVYIDNVELSDSFNMSSDDNRNIELDIQLHSIHHLTRENLKLLNRTLQYKAAYAGHQG